jgi:hypothetical protein
MTIEQTAEMMLQGNDVLIEALKSRNAYGLKKYGKSLDENDIPERERAIHAIQEALDLSQYLVWIGLGDIAMVSVACIAKQLQKHYNLTAQEIIEGGKK